MLLIYLSWFPYVQLTLISLFMLVCFWAIAFRKRAEQNRVWVGLSKETAHQLGTPISSLMAWEEVLKQENLSQEILDEIRKDICRLQTISERFSKIGSFPAPQRENIVPVVEHTVDYISRRTSNRVNFTIACQTAKIEAFICVVLFEWVIENICKNSVDAMEGIGDIVLEMSSCKNGVVIDISDSGKGIAKRNFDDVFSPGYTTKKRGWGLGLSLSKRIIETYHKGKIFVKSSEVGKGTTFRIILKR